MELIVISDGKLKIMLSGTDMKKYDLDEDSLEYNTAETRRAFRHILADAKTKTGFDVGKDKILIQMFPCRSGGCEMFVTKLEEPDLLPEGRPNHNHHSLPFLASDTPASIVYSFSKMTDLTACCRRLSLAGWRGTSSAFHLDDGRWFLFLSGDIVPSPAFSLSTVLNDYGKRERSDTYKALMGEHGREICRFCAVSTLGRL